MGVRVVAEEPGAAGAEHEDPRGDRIVVGRAAAVAAADEHPPDPLAEVAARRMHEERLDSGPRVRDHPAWQTGGRRRLPGRVAERRGQPGQILGCRQVDFLFGLITEHVL